MKIPRPRPSSISMARSRRPAARLRRHARRDRSTAGSDPRPARTARQARRDARADEIYATPQARRPSPRADARRRLRRAALPPCAARDPAAILHAQLVREVVDTFARAFGLPLRRRLHARGWATQARARRRARAVRDHGRRARRRLVVGDYKFDILAGRIAGCAKRRSSSARTGPRREELTDWGPPRRRHPRRCASSLPRLWPDG